MGTRCFLKKAQPDPDFRKGKKGRSWERTGGAEAQEAFILAFCKLVGKNPEG